MSCPRILICNFRAPNLEEFQRWKVYVQWAKDNGMDVCHLTLSITDSFMKGIEGAAQVRTACQVVHLQQNNTFQYQVQKPRREPYSLELFKPEYRRTLSSTIFEAYVLYKAERLPQEFSYLDFLELEHGAFRRIILRLKRKGKIIAHPLRTCPQFYFLAKSLERKASMTENNRVKQMFTPKLSSFSFAKKCSNRGFWGLRALAVHGESPWFWGLPILWQLALMKRCFFSFKVME